MIQKLVIPVNTTTGVKFKDGDLIIYDERNKYFYKTNKEELFAKEQKERQQFIQEVNKKMEEFINETKKSLMDNEKNIKAKIEEVDKYMKNMTKQYNEFIDEFAGTNEKLIDLVEKVIKEQ